MKNILNSIKEMWSKGTKEKVIIVVVALFIVGLIGSIAGVTNKESDSKIKSSETTEKVEKEAKVDSISAVYQGSTTAGTSIDDYSKFVVKVKYDDGAEKEVKDWKVDNPTKLEAEKKVTVTISYKGKTTNVDITCSTVSEATFKAQCTDVPYDELARNGGNHEGEKIKFTGKIVQVMSDGDDVTMRIEVTRGDYDIWDDVVMVGYTYKAGQSKFLEDDIVTFYGVAGGDYTYESTMGADITVPSCYAEYIDLN